MIFTREKVEAVDNTFDDELQVWNPIQAHFHIFRPFVRAIYLASVPMFKERMF